MTQLHSKADALAGALSLPRLLDLIFNRILFGFKPYFSHGDNKKNIFYSKYIIVPILVFIFFYWVFFANYMYDVKLPFYDSAAYQHNSIILQDIVRSQGIFAGIAEIWNQPGQSHLWRFYTVLYAIFFDENWNALIYFHILFQILAILSVFFLGRNVKGDNYVALTMVLLLLALPMYKFTFAGVLDQRLDMTSLAFTVLIVTTGLAWRESLYWVHGVLAGLALGAGILHRPILVVLLFVLLLVLYGATVARHWKTQRFRLIVSTFVYGGVAALLAGAFLIAHFEILEQYYSRNWDNLGADPVSFAEMALLAIDYTADSLGVGTFLIPLGLLASWRYGGRDSTPLAWIIVAGTVTVGLPLTILGAAWNGLVFYPAAAAIILVPLLIDNGQETGRRIIVCLFLTGLVVAIGNLIKLGSDVLELSDGDRAASIAFLDDIRRHRGDDGPLVLGAVTSQPFTAQILIILARQEGIESLGMGPSPAHTYQYGLSREAHTYSQEELVRAIDCTLNEQIASADYVITNDQPEYPASYTFDHRFKPLINARLQAHPDQFADAGIVREIEGLLVRAYLVLDRKPIPCQAPDLSRDGSQP